MGGRTRDVDPAYGWNDIVQKNQADARLNSGNFMYLALGIKMIDDQGLLPQENGDV